MKKTSKIRVPTNPKKRVKITNFEKMKKKKKNKNA